nr:tetratricopeptide repeat protein [Candidatus Sigynarchaeota archaeon]
MKLFEPGAQYTFLAGAGISMEAPSNLPSAIAFVRSILEMCTPASEFQFFAKESHKIRYELIVEFCHELFDADLVFLDYLDIIDRPNPIHFFLASMLLNKQFVITTNFDYLLEHAVKKIATAGQMKDFFPIITREDFLANPDPLALLKIGKFAMYKIHGTKRNFQTREDTSRSLVTTITALGKDREAGKTFTLEGYKLPSVQKLMQGRVLVVMGYSGNDDFDIIPFINESADFSGLVWIDHADVAVPEITEFLPRDQSVNSSSKIDQALQAIVNERKVKVTKIKAHTNRFVQEVLCKQIAGTMAAQNAIAAATEGDSGSESRPPSFPEWIATQPRYSRVQEHKKWVLSSFIYNYLGYIDKQMRCYEQAVKICDANSMIEEKIHYLTFLGEAYRTQGNLSSAMKTFKEAMDLVERSGLDKDKYAIINNTAIVHLSLGDLDTALKSFLQALEIARARQDWRSIPVIMGNIGMIYRNQGKFDLAKDQLAEAVELAGKHGLLFEKAINLSNIGLTYQDRGDFNLARDYFMQAADICEHLGAFDVQATILINLGGNHRSLGQFDEALKCFDKGLELAQRWRLELQKAQFHTHKGVVYRAKGDSKLALKEQLLAKSIAEKVGDLSVLADILGSIASIHQDRKEYDNALEINGKALELAEQIQDNAKKALILSNMGVILNYQGKSDQGIQKFLAAKEIGEKIGAKASLASTLFNLGTAYKDLQNWDKAAAYFTKSVELADQTLDTSAKELALKALLEIYKNLGDSDGLIRTLEAALHMMESQHDPKDKQKIVDQAVILAQLGSIYMQKKEFQLAIDRFKKSAVLTEQLGDFQGLAILYNNIGQMHVELREFKTASEYFEKAAPFAEKIRDHANLLTIYLNMGGNYRDGLQDMQNALRCFKKARDAASHLKNKQAIAGIDGLLKSLK